MKNKQKLIIMVLAIFTLGMTVSGCDMLKKYTGGVGGSKTSSVDTKSIVKGSVKMAKNFAATLIFINYAQGEALQAFGLDTEAEQAKQAAKAFESGVSDDDTKNKIIAETKARDKKIEEMIAKTDKLTGDARVHFAKSAVTYASASYTGALLVNNASDWGSSVKSASTSLSSNPMILANFTKDVAPGMFVVSQLPNLSSQWASTTKTYVAFAKNNGDDIAVDKNLISLD